MRIAYIAAGAGGMYCGSCLRDNALAAELLSQGYDVHLIPTYTPLKTDETDVSETRVFLGGINVFLQQKFGIFRKTPRFLDRLLDLPVFLRLASRFGVRIDPEHLGAMTVSMLRGEAGNQEKEIRTLTEFLQTRIRPDVINLPNSLLMGLAPEFKRALGCPVVCTLQGEDLFIEGLGEPFRTEAKRLIRNASDHVDLFVGVTRYEADFMTAYLNLPPEKVRIVPLGINLGGHSASVRGDERPFTLGYMARIAPEKGLDVLCEAYHRLRRREGLPPSRIAAAGYLAPEHRSYLGDIVRKMASWGLADEFQYHGSLDRQHKIAYLQGLDLFSVPSVYPEPKGLYLLEAMANGIPVAQPRKGAFTEIIQNTGGGVLVEPEDPEALAEQIFRLWKDPDERRQLGMRGRAGVERCYSASVMASAAVEVYHEALGIFRPAKVAASTG